MALRALQGPTGGGAPVGGGGTSSPSTIPRWTGPSTLGDSVLVQVGAGIGLGTSTLYTGTKLQVSGSGGVAAITSEDTNAGGNFLRWLADTTNQPLINWTTGSALRFATSTSAFGTFAEWMRISALGNVGIGTAIPDQRLHVLASNNNPVVVQSSGAATSYIRFYNTGGTNAYIGSSGNNVSLVAGGSERALVTTTSMDISSTSGYGIKLPATPGNTDPQTLDAYRENTTWAPTVTWGTGGTVTTTSATGAYTQIGNVVTFTVTIAYNCSVIPTGGAITMDLPRTSASGFNQRPGSFAFNSWNGVAGTNFLSIGSASATATLRVANATSIADTATYLTVTASGALVVTATYIAS